MSRFFLIGIGAMLLVGCGQGAPGEQLGMERQALPNSNVNVSNQAGTQSEAGIAVNPTNSQNLVMVANDLTDLSKMATWFSTDGGATWTANFIDETEDGLDAGDQRFDPNVAFDS